MTVSMRQSDLIYVSNLGYLYWEHCSFGGCLCFILPYLIRAMHIASLLIYWPYSITHVAILIFCLTFTQMSTLCLSARLVHLSFLSSKPEHKDSIWGSDLELRRLRSNWHVSIPLWGASGKDVGFQNHSRGGLSLLSNSSSGLWHDCSI